MRWNCRYERLVEQPNNRVGVEIVLVAGSYPEQVWKNSILPETPIKRVYLNIEKDVTLDIIDGKNVTLQAQRRKMSPLRNMKACCYL